MNSRIINILGYIRLYIIVGMIFLKENQIWLYFFLIYEYVVLHSENNDKSLLMFIKAFQPLDKFTWIANMAT